MLILSDRHTPADLELWAELEAADCVHGERLLRSGKVEQSLQAIRTFLAAEPAYVSTSWGKDSVACAYLCRLVDPTIPLVNLRIEPTRNPHCDEVRDVFLARWPMHYIEQPVSYHGCGVWFTDLWEKETYRRWDAGWRAVNRSLEMERHLSGVRASESGVRKIRMRVWGLSSPRTCCPIGWWTEADVFGFAAVMNLPLHPNYAMLGGGRWPRDKIRTAELGDVKGTERGRRTHELEYYSDVLHRLEAGQPAR